VPAKPKHPRAAALAVARELCAELRPVTERLIVAGSLRRRKPLVGDVEILYIPRYLPGATTDMFAPADPVNAVDAALATLLAAGRLKKRLTVKGSATWGRHNKYAVHTASGIPVDFFAATEENWFNYLVCRTGGAENNTIVAGAALKLGLRWNPYGPGFIDGEGNDIPVTSEADVYRIAGLPWREPWERP